MSKSKQTLKRLRRSGEINDQLLRLIQGGTLRPGVDSAGDWLRTLSVDELVHVQCLADFHRYSNVLVYPRIDDFLAMLTLLILLEKGPNQSYGLTIESIALLGLRLLSASQFELLARKGFLELENKFQLTGLDEGRDLSFTFRLAASAELLEG